MHINDVLGFVIVDFGGLFREVADFEDLEIFGVCNDYVSSLTWVGEQILKFTHYVKAVYSKDRPLINCGLGIKEYEDFEVRSDGVFFWKHFVSSF